MTTTNEKPGAPTLIPPESSSTSSTEMPGLSSPEMVTDEQISALTGEAAPPGAPLLAPPEVEQVAAEGVTATWRTNVTINALWSIDEVRNAWVSVAGLGWRKLYNGRDGAFQALVTLAGQARQTGRPASLREEADGMIYEIYLW